MSSTNILKIENTLLREIRTNLNIPIFVNSSGSVGIDVGGTDVITIASSGVTMAVNSNLTTVRADAGTDAAPSISFLSDSASGIFLNNFGEVSINETTEIEFSASGTNFVTGIQLAGDNLLDTFVDDTWSPTFAVDSGATGTPSVTQGRYLQRNRNIIAWCQVTGLTPSGGLFILNFDIPQATSANSDPITGVITSVDSSGNTDVGTIYDHNTGNNTTGGAAVVQSNTSGAVTLLVMVEYYV